MNENCTPMQNVIQKYCKIYFKYDAKFSRRIMQNVVKNEWKWLFKNNANVVKNWWKTENKCEMYSKNNTKCSPKIMQYVVEK